jgi:hypothetical protein
MEKHDGELVIEIKKYLNVSKKMSQKETGFIFETLKLKCLKNKACLVHNAPDVILL